MIFSTVDKFLHGGKSSIIREDLFAVLIVTGDIGCFLPQGFGGRTLLLGVEGQSGLALGFVGLGLKVVLYVLFIVVVTMRFLRMSRNSTEVAQLMEMNESEYNWRCFLQALIVIMAIIVNRCILDISAFAENAVGDGHFAGSEVAYYLIDAFLIVWCCIAFVILRPEYRLWEMKTYQEWIDTKSEGKDCSKNELDTGAVIWRRTSWVYN